jgi:coatomer protein complex subunit epsilon
VSRELLSSELSCVRAEADTSLAILAQLLLALDRRDLANSTYATAKRIGNDSTLVQAIEAWIGLKTGSRPLHQAYYFYEELYQLPAGRTPGVLASHAAAHLLLGHAEEAKADIADAVGSGGAADANVLAVATSLGDADAQTQLAATAHPYAAALAAKEAAFDEAAAKFAVGA